MNIRADKLFNQNTRDSQNAAVHLLVKAIDADPADMDNYLQLATYLTTLKDFDQAEALLLRAIHRFGEQKVLLYDLGVLYYEAAFYDKALAQFQKLDRKYPSPDNVAMMARIYFKQQNFGKAVAFALTAHEKRPEDVDFLVLLADSLLSMGQLRTAQDFYQQAYKLAPKDVRAKFGAGITAFVLNHDDNLLTAVKQADPKFYATQRSRLSDIENYLKAQKKAHDE